MGALIAYFSRRGENYVSGKLKELSVGNTEVAAGMLQQLTGADLFQLEPVHEYPKSYNACIDEAQADQRRDARPELKRYPESLDGYDTICTPELFSQGQWQLLSIARAAAAKPKLLLLDEITANLDAETEKEVLEALKRVSENRTVISISHRVSAKMGRIIPIEQKL